MAGLIRIDRKSTWSAAGWVHDAVLEAVTTAIAQFNSSLANEVLRARRHIGAASLNVTRWSPAAFHALRDAVRDSYRRDLAAGPQSFHDRAFFQGHIARLKELIEMLQRDARARDV